MIIQSAFDPGYIKESEIPHAAFLALIDTGTTMSVISPRVIETLQLKPIGIRQVTTIDSQHMTNSYLINIVLRNKVGFVAMEVIGGKLRSSDVLLGMDVITRGDLAITNPDGKTTFSFRIPSVERIDFGQVNSNPLDNSQKK